jgi:hypothetical protein
VATNGGNRVLRCMSRPIHLTAWKWNLRKSVCKDPNIRPTGPLNDPPRQAYIVLKWHELSDYARNLRRNEYGTQALLDRDDPASRCVTLALLGS